MRNHSLFMLSLIGSCLLFVSCTKEDKGNTPEDTTKFSKSSLIGKWAAVDDSLDYVNLYYDIVSESQVKYYDASDAWTEFGIDDEGDLHIGGPNSTSYYRDGYLYTSSNTEWELLGDVEYYFDEKEQIIHGSGGELLGFGVTFLTSLLGSDEIFRIERIGQDEAYIYDLTGLIDDAHIFRIKGVRTAND
ncbi:MAG: hypothetical protein MJZ75_03720 [Paludibacteraceae bacterium]|nr:hypothetical protein [Paludibacteraceae bacterium]